jgi:prepilin-type N-terminal cleavage/methylation domain-containing protein
MARVRPNAGFTLIELMVVIVIVAVVAGAAAPAIGASVRDRKASTATLDVVRTFRVARSSAAGYGVAYLVSFDEEADGGRGSLTVVRGTTNRCNSVDWSASTLLTVDQYRGSDFSNDSDWQIQLRGPVAKLQLCYEPTGVTLWRTGTGRFSEASPTGSGGGPVGGWVFTVDRVEEGTAQGVQRRVVVPLGGDPRVMR